MNQPVTRSLGNVRKIDFLMSTQRDLVPGPDGARYRYVLCSTARCGSSLVGQMLNDSGLAGDPQEYLNPRYAAGYLRSQQLEESARLNAREYLAALERRRTSPNGVFGMKVHFEHLSAWWTPDRAEARARFLKGFDKFVVLYRRDKIAQAVSLYKALKTQIWTSLDYQFLDEDDPRRAIKPEFDPVGISRALAEIIRDETAWRNLLNRQGLPYVELCHEDFVADYEGQSRWLLEQLGVPPGEAKVTAPRLSKQGVDNDAMIGQFKRHIGLADAGPVDG